MLTPTNLPQYADELAHRDPVIARVLAQYGYPPLWAREAGFPALVHIILEQQVSLASAQAAFDKLKAGLNGQITPALFLQLTDDTLRQMGFSRQKTNYCRGLAQALDSGHLNLEQLTDLPDEAVATHLQALKGVGQWTSDIYLTMCLLRPDVLPKGDIALLEAFRVLYGLDARPDHATFVAGTEHWRPFRSVGIRILWHFYLSVRKK